jgi:tetratricopeptide (TPR) repeat protein
MTSVVRWVEVHRLAVAGREAGIARDVGGRVGWVWLARSGFADVARLAGLTLTLGEDARAFYQLGWARDSTGDRAAALAAYDQALRLYRAAGDRGNEAATLSNIGLVYGGLGEPRRALEYYGQALPIRREVGDRAGEAVTLNNIGPGTMPGSGCTMPNPHSPPSPTQPDHTAAAAGAAIRNSGQRESPRPAPAGAGAAGAGRSWWSRVVMGFLPG